ncbi:mammalian cell entry protein [Mycobacterium colombiense]|uniref:Mammalian cell entry protein n=1 Tax=Mycobacterium colombiense TaxID=339268 RepID=A0A1A2RLD9_9MYCO|nr:MlaD family protein [Mycobacterium colombiense]OBH52694.1 mammalian cell entry protein [Mycobacterium colombiense]
MRIRDLITFIAFGAMIALAVNYVASLGVRVVLPHDRTNLSMEVADSNSLVVGSNVLLRGVPVGKVTNIDASVTGATIGFYVDGRYKVPVNSDVRLENLSALGETYIGLVPLEQGGPMLRDGQRIATQRVRQPASISQLATSTMRLLSQLDPEALKRIIDEVDTALPDANSVLPNLSHAGMLLRNVAASMHGTGQDLLDNFQTLLQNAGWVGLLLADIGPGIEAVGHNGGMLFAGFVTAQPLGDPTFVFQFNRFLDRIIKFLDDRAPDLKVLGEALSPQLKGISGALMNFDTGQILSNFLASVPAEGAITLHVTIPPK